MFTFYPIFYTEPRSAAIFKHLGKSFVYNANVFTLHTEKISTLTSRDRYFDTIHTEVSLQVKYM